MKYLIPIMLLFSGCSIFDPSIKDTIETVKSEGGCSHVGTEIKVTIKNLGGIESVRINCNWTVEDEEF